MDFKFGERVVIYDTSKNIQPYKGLEGFVGVGVYLGEFKDKEGNVTRRRARLLRSDDFFDECEGSSIKICKLDEYFLKARQARLELDSDLIKLLEILKDISEGIEFNTL